MPSFQGHFSSLFAICIAILVLLLVSQSSASTFVSNSFDFDDFNSTNSTVSFPLADHTGLDSFQVGLLFTEAPADYESNLDAYQYEIWSALSDITGLNSTYLDLPANASTIYGTQRFLTVVVNVYYLTSDASADSQVLATQSNIQQLHARLLNLKNLYAPSFVSLASEDPDEKEALAEWSTVTTSALESYPISQELGGIRYVSGQCSSDCTTDELTTGNLGRKSGHSTVYLVLVIIICAGYGTVIVLFALFVLAIKLFEKHQDQLRQKLEQEALLKDQAAASNQ